MLLIWKYIHKRIGHHDSFGKLNVTIIDHNPKWDDESKQERESFWIWKLKNLSPNGINEKKYYPLLTPIFARLLQSYYDIQFAQLAQSIYSTLWWVVFWMSFCIIPFSKIFLTVLFDTLTNNVSFLFLFPIKHVFKCVALLCIYIIVVVLLFIYMWDFNSFMYVFSYE
jgi:hypothetical protein